MFKKEYEIYVTNIEDYMDVNSILKDYGIFPKEAEKIFSNSKWCFLIKVRPKVWRKVKHILVRNVKSVSFDGRNAEKEWNEYIYKK